MPDRKKIYLCINIYSLILQKHEKVNLFSYCDGSVGYGSLYRKQSRIRYHRYSRRYLLALYLNVRFQLYKKTIFPLLLVLSGGCNHLLVLAARWIFLKDEYGMSSRYEIQYQMGIVGILLTFALVWSMCREKAQETEADKAKTRAPEKRAVRTPLKVCMLAFTVLTVFGNAWTTRAEIRTAPYRKAYLQVSRELGLNYRTASDEDLETYLHNDPDAVRDAMRILEENHLNIFR